jgi:hypothetical protein
MSVMAIYQQWECPILDLAGPLRLLKQFGIESSIDVVLMDWIVISLECRDQSCYPGGKNDQIAGTGSRRVGVWHPGRHKDCGSGANVFDSVSIAEGEVAVQYMPGFVIGTVDMQGCGAAAPPFMDAERIARNGEGRWLHS